MNKKHFYSQFTVNFFSGEANNLGYIAFSTFKTAIKLDKVPKDALPFNTLLITIKELENHGENYTYWVKAYHQRVFP